MLLRGADILVNVLIERGVDTVFGYPGNSVLRIYDALYKNSDKIHHVLAAHEQGAAHAADGYARSSGKPGVVIATSGPGATNLVTGIAAAYMDSVPMVVITGNVPRDMIGRDSFQEIDTTGITLPITKHSFIVSRVEELADTMRKAFDIAASGRPAPVLIDIPSDVARAECEYIPCSVSVKKQISISNDDIASAAELIRKAKKPLILCGGGVLISHASAELQSLAEKLSAPVISTMPGLTALPNDHPLFFGMAGMYGFRQANDVIHECDLLIAVGTRFSDRFAPHRDTFASQAKILHIDIDNSEINKNIRCDASIVGDAKNALNALISLVSSKKQWKKRQLHTPASSEKSDLHQNLTAGDILSLLHDIVPDATIVTDVGHHQVQTVRNYRFDRSGSLLGSFGLGAMGYGMGAAIGAKFAEPSRNVILITGDGSFHMDFNELATAVTEKINIVVLIMNNRALGMVWELQRLFYGGRYSATLPDRKTDFVALAEAMGAKGFRLEKPSDIADVIKKAVSCGSPAVVDCVVQNEDIEIFAAGK